jgi:hypothetical protein
MDTPLSSTTATTPYLRGVRQRTLLIVGSGDVVVIELNRQAMEQPADEARLEIVPGCVTPVRGAQHAGAASAPGEGLVFLHLRPVARRVAGNPALQLSQSEQARQPGLHHIDGLDLRQETG